MSTTPRYSTVEISAEKARAAAAAAAAARLRLAEAARDRREAALAERKRKFEERQREQVARHEARRQQIRGAEQHGEPANAKEPNRHAAASDRRLRVTHSEPLASIPDRPSRDQQLSAQPSTEQPPTESERLSIAPEQSVDSSDQVAAFDESQPPAEELSPALVDSSVTARAEAETLAEALGAWTDAAQTATDLRRASAELGAALDSEDEPAAIAALAAVRDVVATAHAENDALQQARARRRIIAAGITAALPEHYHVWNLSEKPDGSIRFLASGPDDELLVAVFDDGAGGDLVGYKSEDPLPGQLDAPPGTDDCPKLTQELEDAHARAASEGFTIGPVIWDPHQTPDLRRARRSATNRQSKTQ